MSKKRKPATGVNVGALMEVTLNPNRVIGKLDMLLAQISDAIGAEGLNLAMMQKIGFALMRLRTEAKKPEEVNMIKDCLVIHNDIMKTQELFSRNEERALKHQVALAHLDVAKKKLLVDKERVKVTKELSEKL